MKRELCLLVVILLMCQCKSKSQAGGVPGVEPPETGLPAIKGKIVFHNYSIYGSGDSKVYLYDFSTNKLSTLSDQWIVNDPMNAHFSPDGKQIVFMGKPSANDNWDIYLWSLGSSAQPINLTKGNKKRDEDPKFSPDGKNLVFKQDGRMKIMDLSTFGITAVGESSLEESMPYFTSDGKKLVYAMCDGANSGIYMVNVDGAENKALANAVNVQEYYPIVRDAETYLYSSWYSAGNENDQIYMGYFNGKAPTYLPFNKNNENYSDAYPCGSEYVILSSTRSGTIGGYDLYIAHITSGKIWSLNAYNPKINTTVNELGVSYSAF
ncbi:DPP IV N-terminal domain-containing protein [Pedobacter foliorum]|uniref:TolB family protein n=1 Tax=Pedobacter foliorum TaxID=2739058 RepID=UPI00156375D7|nr:DPP IV N-terminal domain-containing protein [Pedobacter foliorum]NRF41432.1 PD40 domain-containing protein [Pedobacter foliorum]